MFSQHPGQAVAILADLIVEVLPEYAVENIEKCPTRETSHRGSYAARAMRPPAGIEYEYLLSAQSRPLKSSPTIVFDPRRWWHQSLCA